MRARTTRDDTRRRLRVALSVLGGAVLGALVAAGLWLILIGAPLLAHLPISVSAVLGWGWPYLVMLVSAGLVVTLLVFLSLAALKLFLVALRMHRRGK